MYIYGKSLVPFILSNKECRTTDSEQQAIDPKRICKYCGWNMDIEYTYARGKLNEQHYNLLNKKIESFVNSNKKKTSDNIKRSPI